MRQATRRATPLILVTDGWLANAGDAAIHQAMRRSLRRSLRGARVAVACHHRQLVGNRYPDLDLVPPLDPLAGVKWPWTTAADIAERAIAEALVERADLVLVPGGGFMIESYRPEGRIQIYEELLARGKRLMFYAQSIGQFKDADLRRRFAAVLSASELVLLRDESSLETVLEQRSSKAVHLTADEAFLLRKRRRRVSRPRSLLLCVSLHPWEREDGADDLGTPEVQALASSLSHLLARGLAKRVTLASTAQGLGGPKWALEDDAMAAEAVRAAVPEPLRSRISLRSGYVSSDDFMQLAARHTAVVSMRMHGAILAMLAGSPTLLANASSKARSLSERTQGAIPVIGDTTDLARIDDFVADLLDNPREARRSQEAALDQMRARASMNAQLVARQLAAQPSSATLSTGQTSPPASP